MGAIPPGEEDITLEGYSLSDNAHSITQHSMTGKPTCQEIFRVLKSKMLVYVKYASFLDGITTIGGGVFV